MILIWFLLWALGLYVIIHITLSIPGILAIPFFIIAFGALSWTIVGIVGEDYD